MIYRDLEFPLTTSVSTVQRLMKVELERNRRQRTVAFPANLSALRLRPWEAATVALDRLTPFPARVTAWSLAAEGGVDLTLEEEDAAVWDWNPAVDERATGSNPAVVLLGQTPVGRDIGPRLAFRRNTAVAMDCIALFSRMVNSLPQPRREHTL